MNIMLYKMPCSAQCRSKQRLVQCFKPHTAGISSVHDGLMVISLAWYFWHTVVCGFWVTAVQISPHLVYNNTDNNNNINNDIKTRSRHDDSFISGYLAVFLLLPCEIVNSDSLRSPPSDKPYRPAGASRPPVSSLKPFCCAHGLNRELRLKHLPHSSDKTAMHLSLWQGRRGGHVFYFTAKIRPKAVKERARARASTQAHARAHRHVYLSFCPATDRLGITLLHCTRAYELSDKRL